MREEDVMDWNSRKEIIKRHFPQEMIKHRRGLGGMTLDYVETPEYIRRLNEAFEHCWSWKILEHFDSETHVVVVGELTLPAGVTKQAFGTSTIIRSRSTGKMINYGDDLKAAASDALKKACSLVGIGLHIWSDDPKEEPPGPIETVDENGKKTEYFEESLPKDTSDHGKKVEKVISLFKQYEITPYQLERWLNKPDGLWDIDDFAKLKEMAKEIKAANQDDLKEIRKKHFGGAGSL